MIEIEIELPKDHLKDTVAEVKVKGRNTIVIVIVIVLHRHIPRPHLQLIEGGRANQANQAKEKSIKVNTEAVRTKIEARDHLLARAIANDLVINQKNGTTPLIVNLIENVVIERVEEIKVQP